MSTVTGAVDRVDCVISKRIHTFSLSAFSCQASHSRDTVQTNLNVDNHSSYMVMQILEKYCFPGMKKSCNSKQTQKALEMLLNVERSYFNCSCSDENSIHMDC